MQPATFANLVEQVQQLSTDEKQELWQLLEKYLLEERRNDILARYQALLGSVFQRSSASQITSLC